MVIILPQYAERAENLFSVLAISVVSAVNYKGISGSITILSTCLFVTASGSVSFMKNMVFPLRTRGSVMTGLKSVKV
jgi:hypothetical protein